MPRRSRLRVDQLDERVAGQDGFSKDLPIQPADPELGSLDEGAECGRWESSIAEIDKTALLLLQQFILLAKRRDPSSHRK